MKVIDQYHEILHITPDVLALVEKAGRNCYKSEHKIGPGSDKKFIEMINKNGHHSVSEHSQITVRLVTDRGVMSELTRHRVGIAFSIESTRYCRYSDDITFIRPVWCSEKVLGEWQTDHLSITDQLDSTELLWFSACEQSLNHYTGLLYLGWSPQKARQVLNNSLKTDIVMTTNLRSMKYILQLRTQSAAHPQIRALMFNLMADLQQQIPIVFDDIILKNGLGENGND